MQLKIGIILLGLLCCSFTNAAELNLYIWAGQIPQQLIHQFTEETGISVNINLYDSNEVMYAKLKSSPKSGYDIVSPSTYFVQKLKRAELLQSLDKSKLPNMKYLDQRFLNQAYDPGNQFSIPLQWGATGIFVNRHLLADAPIQSWSDLWQSRYKNQLALLDDVRDVFGMALIKCGYSPNDENPAHIKEAYQALKALRPNIKLYNNNALQTLMTDEDVLVGMTWNATVVKAAPENASIEFIYPNDGYSLWVDSLSIVKTAPHKAAAYQFLNFILRPDVSATLMKYEFAPVPNAAAIALLPYDLRHNRVLFPLDNTLARGTLLLEVSPATMALFEHYWQRLRIS